MLNGRVQSWRGYNYRADATLNESTYEGVTSHGFRALCPGCLAGKFGLGWRPSAPQHARARPARRPARLRAVLAGRAPQPTKHRKLCPGKDDPTRREPNG